MWTVTLHLVNGIRIGQQFRVSILAGLDVAHGQELAEPGLL